MPPTSLRFQHASRPASLPSTAMALAMLFTLLLAACSLTTPTAQPNEIPPHTHQHSPDHTHAETSQTDRGVADDNDEIEQAWPQRPAVPPDPTDPEPIGSTGSNTRDLIRSEDPTTFLCLSVLGQGPEEILDRQKQSYESVPDAYLFRAEFTDGAPIDIRVHPEVGSAADAAAHVEPFLTPLGQLPALLRIDIGRLAIRLGDETATASHLEGISMQTGNIARRLANNRLEETLFHEAVHTSLDAEHAYQRSTEWLAAQAADGRFLTEYGRENPDTEDLAESMLYAFALLQHPDRLPADAAAEIRERIPHRIAYIEQLLMAGSEPATWDASASCAN